MKRRGPMARFVYKRMTKALQLSALFCGGFVDKQRF